MPSQNQMTEEKLEDTGIHSSLSTLTAVLPGCQHLASPPGGRLSALLTRPQFTVGCLLEDTTRFFYSFLLFSLPPFLSSLNEVPLIQSPTLKISVKFLSRERIYICVCIYIHIYIYTHTHTHTSSSQCLRVSCLSSLFPRRLLSSRKIKLHSIDMLSCWELKMYSTLSVSS